MSNQSLINTTRCGMYTHNKLSLYLSNRFTIDHHRDIVSGEITVDISRTSSSRLWHQITLDASFISGRTSTACFNHKNQNG